MASIFSGENKHNLLKQVGGFSWGPIAGAAINTAMLPIITRTISPEEFGKSSLFTLVHTIFSLISILGLDQAFVRYYNSDIEKKKVLFNAILLPIIICFITIIGILIFKKSLSVWLFGIYEPGIMILLSVLFPSLLFRNFGLLIVRLELRGNLYSFLNIAYQTINFIFLLGLLHFFEKSFKAIVYAFIIATILSAVVVLYYTKDVWTFRWIYFDKKIISALLRFSIPLVPATILSWGLHSFDKLGLKWWSSPEQLGLYAASFKVVSLLSIIQSIFTTVWVPIAYKWYENKVDNKQFDRVSVVILSAMTIGYAIIVICRDILLLFLGPEYRNISLVLIYLLFVPVMYTISETTVLGIAFAKKTEFNIYISIIAVTLNIVGNYLLIPQFGARGAAISTAISYLVFFWARTLFSRKLWYKFGLGKYFISFIWLFMLNFVVEFDLSKIFEFLMLVIIFIYSYFLLNRIKLWPPVITNKGKN